MEAFLLSSNSTIFATSNRRSSTAVEHTSQSKVARLHTNKPKSSKSSNSTGTIRCELGSFASSSQGGGDGGGDLKPVVSGDWRTFRARLVALERSQLAQDPSSPPYPIIVGDKWAHAIHEPEKGCLLIATEKLDGVHIFERTVILLFNTADWFGPKGVILNRPSLMSIKEARSSAMDPSGTFSGRPLFFGGPLQDGLLLVSGPSEGGGKDNHHHGVFEEVIRGLYVGRKESVGCAAEMVKRDLVGVGDFSFFEGYCGWGKEQLIEEIRAGCWTLAACSSSVIGGLLGGVGCSGLWEEVLGFIGPRLLL